jgi:Ricin-type beta-trefoil lectin domain
LKSKQKRNVMNKNIACFSLLPLVLPLSACVADATNEASDSEPTEEAASPLSEVWPWVSANKTNGSPDRCLEDRGWYGWTFPQPVASPDCDDGKDQNWRLVGDQIIDQATGLCLDSDSTGYVYTLPCNGDAFQKWTVTYKGLMGIGVSPTSLG